MHNGSRGNAQPTPEATIGAARAAHNRANSHGIRISHARRGRTVLQLDNVPGTARQHEPVPCHATCNRGGGGYRFATAGMHMRSESRRRPPTCRAEQLPSTLSHLCWATACLSSSFPEPPLNGVLRSLPDPSLPRLCRRPCRPLEPGIELLVLPQRQPPWIAISQPLHVRLLRLPVQHLQP